MFPHIVTVFNVIQTKDSVIYHRKIVSDVFCYKNDSISKDGKGDEISSLYNVIFSSVALEKWVPKKEFDVANDVYTFQKNDIIVLGEYGNINDLSELQKSNADFFLIKSIKEHLYGDEELKNIEVSN